MTQYTPVVSEAVSFPGVWGHQHTQRMLARAIERGKLHHSLLLVGPRGIGKATLARGLACALSCEVKPSRGCGECSTCERILRRTHPDLAALEGQGKSRSILTDDARQAAIRCQHAPFEAPAHVLVIDPADRMQAAAAAALLKTIEEPPPGVYFVLLAENLGGVLDTLVSRSTTLSLSPLSQSDVRAVVDVATRKESLSLDPKRVELGIRLSEGCPGAALEFATDPSLEIAERMMDEIFQALTAGSRGIFVGERSPLWKAWSELLEATPSGDAPPPEEEAVVVVKGKKGRKKKSAKATKKESKDSPARQRNAALKLSTLWLLRLHEQLKGERPTPASLQLSPRELTQHIGTVQSFQASLARNPNVRLALESTLLKLSA